MDAAADRKQPKQIAVIVVLLLLAGGIFYYRMFASDPSRIVPKDRTLSSWTVNWRCLACGNEFKETAGQGPRKCPKCQKDQAYVTFTWTCASHGPFLVAFQYDDKEDPQKVKVGEKDWVNAMTPQSAWNIKCPVCGASLMSPAGP